MLRCAVLSLILVFIWPLAAQALDSCVVPNGTAYNIDELGTCKRVTNNHASGLSIMVPTKTAAEWSTGSNAFLNALPPGASVANCTGGGGGFTYTDWQGTFAAGPVGRACDGGTVLNQTNTPTSWMGTNVCTDFCNGVAGTTCCEYATLRNNIDISSSCFAKTSTALVVFNNVMAGGQTPFWVHRYAQLSSGGGAVTSCAP